LYDPELGLCSGGGGGAEGCPLRKRCWRWCAPADPEGQLFIDPSYDSETGECENLMEFEIRVSGPPGARVPNRDTIETWIRDAAGLDSFRAKLERRYPQELVNRIIELHKQGLSGGPKEG